MQADAELKKVSERTDTELKNSICPNSAQRNYRRESGWKCSALIGTERKNAELKNSICPNGAQRIYRRESGWKCSALIGAERKNAELE